MWTLSPTWHSVSFQILKALRTRATVIWRIFERDGTYRAGTPEGREEKT